MIIFLRNRSAFSKLSRHSLKVSLIIVILRQIYTKAALVLGVLYLLNCNFEQYVCNSESKKWEMQNTILTLFLKWVWIVVKPCPYPNPILLNIFNFAAIFLSSQISVSAISKSFLLWTCCQTITFFFQIKNKKRFIVW